MTSAGKGVFVKTVLFSAALLAFSGPASGQIASMRESLPVVYNCQAGAPEIGVPTTIVVVQSVPSPGFQGTARRRDGDVAGDRLSMPTAQSGPVNPSIGSGGSLSGIGSIGSGIAGISSSGVGRMTSSGIGSIGSSSLPAYAPAVPPRAPSMARNRPASPLATAPPLAVAPPIAVAPPVLLKNCP